MGGKDSGFSSVSGEGRKPGHVSYRKTQAEAISKDFKFHGYFSPSSHQDEVSVIRSAIVCAMP